MRRLALDDETKRQWAIYEAQNEAARIHYRQFPIALGNIGNTTCHSCGGRTFSRYGICRRCRREES